MPTRANWWEQWTINRRWTENVSNPRLWAPMAEWRSMEPTYIPGSLSCLARLRSGEGEVSFSPASPECSNDLFLLMGSAKASYKIIVFPNKKVPPFCSSCLLPLLHEEMMTWAVMWQPWEKYPVISGAFVLASSNPWTNISHSLSPDLPKPGRQIHPYCLLHVLLVGDRLSHLHILTLSQNAKV